MAEYRRATGRYEFLCEAGHRVVSTLRADIERCPACCVEDGTICVTANTPLHDSGCGHRECGAAMDARIIDYQPSGG